MTSTNSSLNTTGPSLSAMTKIEVKRLVRNPFFILANLVTFGLMVLFVFNATDEKPPGDLLSWPVIPAFFIGLTSLVLMARQTRSTEVAAEAMNAAPGTEGRRTVALALACLVPAFSGLVFVIAEIGIAMAQEPVKQEWWFDTLPDAQVWGALLSNAPIACLGGGLLGVLIGRWLRFPGASAVVVVVLVAVCMLGQYPAEETTHPVLRLWTPWSSWQSGTNEEDGTMVAYGGNAAFYLVYTLCLCAAAVIAAVWHDRAARTRQLRTVFAGTVLVGLVGLGLSMTTGTTDNQTSDPVPWFEAK